MGYTSEIANELITEKFLVDNNFNHPGAIADDCPYTYETDKYRVTVCLFLNQYIYLENKETEETIKFKYRSYYKLKYSDLKKCLDFVHIEDIFLYDI